MLDTRAKSLDLREKLNGRLLVGDGAMGTLLADRGVDQPYNMANLAHAQLVRAVHEEYLRAGAKVIETNTGSRLAREAVDVLPRGEDAFVLGSIAPHRFHPSRRGEASGRWRLPQAPGFDAPCSRGRHRIDRLKD